MTLSSQHEAIVTRALVNVPPDTHDAIRKYVADRLRPIRETTEADVRHVVCAAIVKYGVTP